MHFSWPGIKEASCGPAKIPQTEHSHVPELPLPLLPGNPGGSEAEVAAQPCRGNKKHFVPAEQPPLHSPLHQLPPLLEGMRGAWGRGQGMGQFAFKRGDGKSCHKALIVSEALLLFLTCALGHVPVSAGRSAGVELGAWPGRQ